MAAERDFYEVLGVDRAAGSAEIHRAYRRLARRFHPDVSADPAAQERFREITAAYEVLSNAETRARYDRGRHPGSPGTASRRPDSTDWQPGGRRVRVNRIRSPGMFDAAREAVVELDLEDAYSGGRGRVMINTALGVREVEVTVPAGVTDGDRIRLPGYGAVGPGGWRGDLYLVVRLAPHPRYRVSGRDLTVDLPVAPWEAALGATVPIETLGGTVQVDVPPGSSGGRRLRLRGRGLPNPLGEPGDLYAEVRIVVPPNPSPEERALYERLARESTFDPRAPA